MLTPARLVVGVTGHRRLADRDRVAAEIDAVLDRITSLPRGEWALRETEGSRSRSTPQAALRLVALSPLAEGADRLVAERVLAREGAELEAVLPMDEADYERDFADDASRSEFRSLLARAEAIHRLPASTNREEAYAAAGRFVVDRCDVLIAIWNGRLANGHGGTADIVAYARSRSRRLFVIELPD